MIEWVPGWLNLTLMIVGVVGLPAIISVVIHLRDLSVGRRFMRLHPQDDLTVVLPTSGHEVGGAAGARYERHTVNRPSLDALVSLTSLIARLGYNKNQEVVLSASLAHRIPGDLMLVGGPLKNEISREFVARFNEAHHDLRIERLQHDDGTWQVCVGGKVVAALPNEAGQAQDKDIAVLLVWKNPFSSSGRMRRGMMFAGFTGMGNAAAVQYLDEDVPKKPYRYRAWRWKRSLPGLYSRKWPMFIAVLDVWVKDQGVRSSTEKFFARIPEAQ